MKIRLETPSDYLITENLTREAFWNVYRPGCTEHYVLHKCRLSSDFIPELCLVLEENDKIIAHIVYLKNCIKSDDGKIIPTIMLGPVSVLPEKQHMGYGKKIIEFSLAQAEKLGYGAVTLIGNTDYYHRFGFESASKFNIFYPGIPRDEEAPFVMVKELNKGYLNAVCGEMTEPPSYTVSDDELDEFDKNFAPKTKEKLPGQLG